MWRVIWLVPAFIGIAVVLLVHFFFPYETVAFCLIQGKDKEAMLHMKKVYKQKSAQDPDKIE